MAKLAFMVAVLLLLLLPACLEGVVGMLEGRLLMATGGAMMLPHVLQSRFDDWMLLGGKAIIIWSLI
jgi:hypothetical protein